MRDMLPLKKIAKKHLGQNFLVNVHIAEKMISSACLSSEDVVLEIGPGLGALTRKICDTGARVIALEKDSALIPKLRQTIMADNFELVEGDVLTYDFAQIPVPVKVIGNIPYNISTQIIERLIDNRTYFSEVFLTTQLEFAKRLTAVPGTKDFGSLTCFLQYHADVEILFSVSARCFCPVPKVTSSFIRMRFREPELQARNPGRLFKLIGVAFQQRRKKIENSLAGMFERQRLEEIMGDLGIREGSRADQISLQQYIRLSNAVATPAG